MYEQGKTILGASSDQNHNNQDDFFIDQPDFLGLGESFVPTKIDQGPQQAFRRTLTFLGILQQA
jgi:hypothetical protein